MEVRQVFQSGLCAPSWHSPSSQCATSPRQPTSTWFWSHCDIWEGTHSPVWSTKSRKEKNTGEVCSLRSDWSIVPWVPMEAITLPLFDRVVEPMSNGMWPMMTKLEASHGLKSQGRSPSCYSMRQSTLSHHWSRSPSFGGKAFRFKTAKKTALPPWWQILWTLGFVICAKERRLFEEEQIQKEARRKAEAQRCDRCGHVIGV